MQPEFERFGLQKRRRTEANDLWLAPNHQRSREAQHFGGKCTYAVISLLESYRLILQELKVVSEDSIFVLKPTDGKVPVVRIEFNPTVPHCSLATLIGLTIRIKILRHFPHNLKLDIYIKKGAHSTEDEINKQINDRKYETTVFWLKLLNLGQLIKWENQKFNFFRFHRWASCGSDRESKLVEVGGELHKGRRLSRKQFLPGTWKLGFEFFSV